MIRAGWFLAILVYAISAAAGTADQILTFTTLGPVQVGMTVPEAEKALGASLKPLDPKDGVSTETCWLTERTDGIQPWLTYMVRNKRIVRFDIWEEAGSVVTAIAQNGVRVGSTEKEVMETYAGQLDVAEHPHMGKDGRYLTLLAPDKRHGVVFETVDGKVVNLRAGEVDSIALEETCA